jgi:hypothetical protein
MKFRGGGFSMLTRSWSPLEGLVLKLKTVTVCDEQQIQTIFILLPVHHSRTFEMASCVSKARLGSM